MRTYCLLFFWVSFFSHVALAKNIPTLKSPVMDEAGLLTNSTKNKLADALLNYEKKHGPQIQVYLTNSLDGESLEGFTIKVVDEWKIGKKGNDDGVLFFMAIKERALRIEVGRGLEGKLTDLQAGRIISATIPYFQAGDFQAGILHAVGAIATQIGAPLEGAPTAKYKSKSDRQNNSLTIVAFIVFIILLSFFRRKRFGIYGPNSLGYYRGNMPGGRSGGFSSWRGGGGGFSGGGASGRW